MCPSHISIATLRSYSMTMPNCVLVEIQMHSIELILRKFPNCVLVETQLHLIKIILRKWQIVTEPKSLASHRKFFMTAPYCVLAKIQLHLIEFILRQIWNVSSSKFKCISSKLLYDICELCPSRISIASYRKHSKTIPNCVWAEIQVHLIENILKQLHNAS